MLKIILFIGFIIVLYIIVSMLLNKTPKEISESKNNILNKHINGINSSDKALLIESFEDAFDIRFELFKMAKISIDIAYYTFQDGIITKFFINELNKAAKRGVKIRILLDGKLMLFSKKTVKMLKILNRYDNVEVAFYNKLNLFNPRSIQSILHDKLILVDNNLLLSGGRNIGDKYFNPVEYEKTLSNDIDIFVKKGNEEGYSVVDDAEIYFSNLWNSNDTKLLSSKKKSSEMKQYLDEINLFISNNKQFFKKDMNFFINSLYDVESSYFITNPINASRKEPWVGYYLGLLISNAKNYILIKTPFSTGNKKILKVLSKPKIQEKLMLTNSAFSTANIIAYSNYLTNRRGFLNANFKIYEYQSHNSIHGKILLIDDNITVIGSFNLDDRSLYFATENMVFIKSRQFQNNVKNTILSKIQSQSMLVNKQNEYITKPAKKAKLLKVIYLKIVGVISQMFRLFI